MGKPRPSIWQGIKDLAGSVWDGIGGFGGMLATAAPFFLAPNPLVEDIPVIVKVNYLATI